MPRIRSLLLLLAAASPAVMASPPSLHDRSVVFENSAGDGWYYDSEASAAGPSELEIAGGRVPVESRRCVSPPNCLRLKWRSVPGGDWRAVVRVPQRYARTVRLEGDALSLWCYSEDELLPDDSPRVRLQDASGAGLPEIRLLALHGPLSPGKWVEIRLPFTAFKSIYNSTDDNRFEAERLASVTFVQGLDDDKPHELLIDDVRVVPTDPWDAAPPAAPTGLTVEGHDSHFDLAWTRGDENGVLSYRIYRSWDGSSFEPIATRPAGARRATDHVGGPGKTAHYRVTAVDARNRESAPSNTAVGATRAYSDDELLDMVQRGCFRYYWEAGNPDSGMAVEVLPGDDNLVALGASGFGIMALVAAADREFVSRDDAVERMLKIVRFLDGADRFHGVWPHFLDGRTGRVTPLFGKYDNGGDLVETAFIVQGLLAARQYFDRDTAAERELRATITRMWEEVEWDWYRRTPESEVLYWHWSPDHGWHIGHPLVGWNETMIIYLLAIASPTHPVPASMYHTGFAGQSEMAVQYRRGWSRTTQGDHYTNGNTYFGRKLDVGCGSGGELFFTQFSFLGFDPRGKRDRSTNYFANNRQIALINRAYCMANPLGRKGYGPDCWGRSAGINSGGGRAQPRDDNGTICTSASLGCFPYTPEESLAALKHFYRDLGGKIWGVYGFHDGFNETENWFDEVYMGLNQAQIVVGIENHRTGLVWRRFMANPEIGPALEAIGFAADPNGDTPAE